MRVLLVDDHAAVRKAFAVMLAQEPDIEIVGEAADGKVAVEMTRNLLPEAVADPAPAYATPAQPQLNFASLPQKRLK